MGARWGRVASDGCIRIPATLNVVLDIHGVLDADYWAAVASGGNLGVLKPHRQTISWPGRDIVIVDLLAAERPSWSPPAGVKPLPSAGVRAPTPIVSARDDRYGTFASAQHTASRITGAKFIGFEQGGHTWVGHDAEVMSEVVKLLAPLARP